jgi:hypothetical protein
MTPMSTVFRQFLTVHQRLYQVNRFLRLSDQNAFAA